MRGLLVGCWLLLCLPALLQAASWRYLSADQAPDSNQAVLLLVIDSEVELGSLLLRGPSGLIRLRPAARRQQRLATQPDEGGEHALLLLELPPGEYRIERIDQLSPAGRVAPGAAWQTPFLLRAGELSYPGDLRLLLANSGAGTQTRRENRLAHWLRLLPLAAPWWTDWTPRWVGPGIDAFPAYWHALGRALPAGQVDPVPADSAPCDETQDWRCSVLPALLRSVDLPLVSVSPSATWLLRSQRSGRRLSLRLEHLASGTEMVLPVDVGLQSRMAWCGDDCLSLTHGRGAAARVVVLQLQLRATGIDLQRHSVPVAGEVLDALPDRPDALLFGRTDDPSGQDSLELYRLDLAAGRIQARQLQRRRRLDGSLRDELGWLSDPGGEHQLALTRDLQGHRLVRPTGEVMLQAPIDSHLDLLGLNETAVLALTDLGQPLRRVIAYPLAGGTPSVLAEVECPDCASPTIDAAAAMLDDDGTQWLALRHFRQGLLQTQLRDATDRQRVQRWLGEARGSGFELARVTRADRPEASGWLYRTEAAAGLRSDWWWQPNADTAPRHLGAQRPWLDCDRVSDSPGYCRDGQLPAPRSETVRTRSADGWPLEAMLTLPPAVTGPEQPHPLLLLPHGGPLGVAADRHFDPLVLWLSYQGYAVLQVNFRGSFGYGRAFRDVAFGEAGRGIEQDQLAVLDQLLATDHRIDGQRICSIGTSYGGYSALMLALLRPAQIDCVVAFAPFTDLPLRHLSSDWNDDPLQTAVQLRLYGDPAVELATMQARSPLYRHRALRQPLLLGHGRLDRRVHPEHVERLALLLTAAGLPPTLQWFDNEAHGLQRLDNQLRWYRAMTDFLRRQLADPTAGPPVPH
ncbi:MAG: prolyl oligopeptidase family serine peptidase [Lysobacterales bacterium]